jgi:uncharacterized RDD family membrane protein YckC
MAATASADALPPPGLFRRLAAIVYDALLLVAIQMIAAAPVVIVLGGPVTGGLRQLAFRCYLLAIVFGFFGWFWTHGGQTLGMRAWRLKLVSADGSSVGWAQSAWRFAAAFLSFGCLGLGFLWAAFDPKRLTWHDRLSRSRLILLAKPARQPTKR